MKISDLIRKLQIIQERNGDIELEFGVKDYYSIYTETMELYLEVGEPPQNHFSGYHVNGNWGRLQFSLKPNYEGKQPKITFRKPS
jgi:hypothetical protein